MAFPGSRTWKLRRPIKASVITGALNFDGVFCLRHGDFPDSAKTLNGADAMQQYGTDLAVSSDEAGTTRLALQVVRCELDATPANSRIELWVRVPSVSDTVDTDIWIWWGDATETQPAVDADYGRDDVWNGTTGGGTPLVSFGVWHFDELPSDPTPQHKDSSGNAHDVEGSTSNSRIDGTVGRALSTTVGRQMVTTGFFPGTGDWCIIQVLTTCATEAMYSAEGTNYWIRPYSTGEVYFVACSAEYTTGVVAGTSKFVAISRDGANANYQLNGTNGVITTSGASEVCGSTGDARINAGWGGSGTCAYHLDLHLLCAPNAYWLRALYDNLLGTTIWDTTYSPAPAEIQASILFDGVHAGTEIRVYEEPHPQIWAFDLDALTPAGLSLTYIQFQIQGASSASDHYVWFRLDGSGTDPAPGGTGHRVDVATGDTAAEMAEAAQAILDAVTDLGASVSGTVVTVTNDRNGELASPVDGGTDAAITLVQVGGTATDEIDGIESSTGTSWTATYSSLAPRRATIVMLSISYENVRYSAIISTSGLVVPAGALQRLDRNYANPT